MGAIAKMSKKCCNTFDVVIVGKIFQLERGDFHDLVCSFENVARCWSPAGQRKCLRRREKDATRSNSPNRNIPPCTYTRMMSRSWSPGEPAMVTSAAGISLDSGAGWPPSTAARADRKVFSAADLRRLAPLSSCNGSSSFEGV